MKLEGLKRRIKSGDIDTVIVAAPDVSGKLVGKRFTGQTFIDTVAKHGTHGCNYLLTVDIEMEPQTGFRLANWEKGFGDFEFRPDLETLRILPWQTATALVLCDFHHHDGKRVNEAPRSVLRLQLERLTKRGFICNIASELEFFLFNTTYPDALASGYRTLPPASDYRIDYHIMQPTQDESLFRQIRNDMVAAEIPVESSKGEWGRGQHEINFIYNEPLRIADMHSIFKQGVKEIATQRGKCVTFMAKPFVDEPGSSCHIHTSLWRDGKNSFWDAKGRQGSKLFRQFLAGQMKYSRELCYFFAPTINANKR